MNKKPRCTRCKRELKNPASIAAGIGPVCSGRGGGGGRSFIPGPRTFSAGHGGNGSKPAPYLAAAGSTCRYCGRSCWVRVNAALVSNASPQSLALLQGITRLATCRTGQGKDYRELGICAIQLGVDYA